ncbi:ribonuclease H-like domain-containing protein [Tanacetum coccineum]
MKKMRTVAGDSVKNPCDAVRIAKRRCSVQNEFRRYSRVSKLSAKLNDYVIDSKLKYGLEKLVSYAKLNIVNYFFATTLNESYEPATYYDAIKNPKWIKAINDEIEALYRNKTWTITDLPFGRKAIGLKWILKIKYKALGEIKRYSARLVAKGFSQREGFDYDETFSPMVKMVTVRCLISIDVMNGWSLYQLDINNAFLYGDLVEDAPKQWNAKLTVALVEHGFVQIKFDYSLYTKESGDIFLALLVYVDDIVITGNCKDSIDKFKMFLKNKFMIKYLGILKYFLAKPATTHILENIVLSFKETENDKLLSNITEYQKLMYCKCPGFFERTRSNPLTKSSAEAEIVFAASTCEVIWICNVLSDLKVTGLFPVDIFYDSSSATQIASNHVFYEKTKHFELDVHIVREKVDVGVIKTVKIHTTNQVADIFTKGLSISQHQQFCNGLGLGLKLTFSERLKFVLGLAMSKSSRDFSVTNLSIQVELQLGFYSPFVIRS